jgi:GntR family transcriptional regulator
MSDMRRAGDSHRTGVMAPDGLGRLTVMNNGTKPNSTMGRMKVDFAEGTPLYQQVAAEIRRAIAEGEARPGERMPLAKDLATVLGVNTNTVLRALRQLRDEGMLEFRRGRGITVAGTPERGVVMARVKDLVAFARQQGYQPAEVIAMIEAVS